MPDLLLHSLTNFEEIIVACLDAARPRRIAEIGSESGAFTGELVTWASANDAEVICVEPEPSEAVRDLATRTDRLRLLQGLSPGVLSELDPCDLYLIDGDHNYWTVSQELGALYADDRAPVSVLHDVGWPCARRDLYYNVDALPPDAVHPHSHHDGAIPGQDDLVPDRGFSGAGNFAFARHEGGPRNGVLTAVEDFLATRPDLNYVHVPAVFGLGFVYSSKAGYAAAIGTLLAPYDRMPLLERLERNRVEMYSQVIHHHKDSTWGLRERLNRALRELEDRESAAGVDELRSKLEEESQRRSAAAPGDGA